MADLPKRIRTKKGMVFNKKRPVRLKDGKLGVYDPNFTEVDSGDVYPEKEWKVVAPEDELIVYDSLEETDIGTFEDGLEASYTFKNYDETVLKTGKVKDGETPVAPADPTRAADAEYTYTFSGWNPALGPINKNTSFIAQYSTTVNTYSIQFRSGNDSTKGMLVVTGGQYPGEYSTYLIENLPYGTAITVNDNAITVGEITLTATPASGYTFGGWGEVPATVTGNTDITASFESAEDPNFAIIRSDLGSLNPATLGATIALGDNFTETINGRTYEFEPTSENEANVIVVIDGVTYGTSVTAEVDAIVVGDINVILQNIISCTNRAADANEYKFFGNLLLGKVETDPETGDSVLTWTPVGQDPSAGILGIKAAFEAVDDQQAFPMYIINNDYISGGFVSSRMELINNVYNNPSSDNIAALTTAIDTAMQEMETFTEWMEVYAYSSDGSSIQLFGDSSSSGSYIDVTVDQGNVTYTPYGIYASDAGTNVISAISQAMNASDWSALTPSTGAMGDIDNDSYVALGELFGYGSAATSSNITEAAAAVTASLPNFVDFGGGE